LNTLRHRRSIALAVLVIAFALVASACSSSDDTATETTVASATETTVPVEAPTDDTRLSGLTVVDDTTFTVELTEADPEFPLRLAYTAFMPLPSAAYENTLSYNFAPIGNGPFMFPEGGEWEQDTAIDLVRFPDFAGDAPVIDAINFVISADIGTDYIDAQAGNLDVLTSIEPDRLASAPTDFDGRYAESPSTVILYMAIPAYLPEFTKEHRQAMNMAIDRDLIIEKIFNGSGEAAHSVVPSNLGGRSDVCPSWNYDPDAAKALWDAAGPMEIPAVWFNAGAGHEDWVAAVVQMWDNVLGVDSSKTVFESYPWADYITQLDNGEATGPFRLGWGQDYPSPLNFLEPIYASYMTPPTGSNDSFYNSPDFDAAIAAGKAAVAASGNVADGVAHYEAAEDILCDDAQTMPIRFGLNQFVWNENVDNVNMDSYANIDYLQITAENGVVRQDLQNPRTLFPMDTNESAGTNVLMGNLFTGLIRYDAKTGEQLLANAESITTDDNGLTWTIVLKDGWTFHNGEAVTAQSYADAWSFGANAAYGFVNNGFYAKIKGYDELNAG
jgi:oligopeptide transport system substrate-binding protein